MRCYTWKKKCDNSEDDLNNDQNGDITKGLKVTHDEKGKDIIFLGDSGNGGFYQKITMMADNPPQISNGNVYIAYPSSRSKNIGHGFRILETELGNPRPSRMKFMIRINTSTQLEGKSEGKIITLEGKPKLISAAHGSRGGRQKWPDNLYTLENGDVLKIQPEGGVKRDYMVVMNNNGNIICKSFFDYSKKKKEVNPEIIADKAIQIETKLVKPVKDDKSVNTESSVTKSEEELAPSAFDVVEDQSDDFIEPEDECPFDEFEKAAEESLNKVDTEIHDTEGNVKAGA